jgi:hypothetical protein
LADNATAAGTWNFTNQEQLGTAAVEVLTLPSTITGNIQGIKIVNLDSRYQVLVFGAAASVFAVVYDNLNNVFGSVVLVRSTAFSNFSMPIKVSATSLIVASCNNTTAFEAVLLSVSGTTITVNTAATATLGGNFANFADVQVVGSSYVFAYQRQTGISGLRALTVSGTTITIGSEATVTGASSIIAYNIFKTSGTTFLSMSWNGTNSYVTPVTVSGTTLTVGTQAFVATTFEAYGTYLNPNNRLMFIGFSSGQWRGHVASVSGTTASISTVNLVPYGSGASQFADARVGLWSGSQMLLMFFQNNAAGPQYGIGFNVLTDNAGTAVAGTVDVTQQSNNIPAYAYVSGFDSTSAFVTASYGNGVPTGRVYITAGISGNNPVRLSTQYYVSSEIINNAEGGAPAIEATYSQRAAASISSMGNPTRGEFMGVSPSATNTYGNNIGARMTKNGVSLYTFKATSLSNASSTFTGTPSVFNTVSNTFSDTTTLNQFGEFWGVAAVQAVIIGGLSYNKVVVSRLVYA